MWISHGLHAVPVRKSLLWYGLSTSCSPSGISICSSGGLPWAAGSICSRMEHLLLFLLSLALVFPLLLFTLFCLLLSLRGHSKNCDKEIPSVATWLWAFFQLSSALGCTGKGSQHFCYCGSSLGTSGLSSVSLRACAEVVDCQPQASVRAWQSHGTQNRSSKELAAELMWSMVWAIWKVPCACWLTMLAGDALELMRDSSIIANRARKLLDMASVNGALSVCFSRQWPRPLLNTWLYNVKARLMSWNTGQRGLVVHVCLLHICGGASKPERYCFQFYLSNPMLTIVSIANLPCIKGWLTNIFCYLQW